MVRRKRKDRPGPGYLLRLEWSPEVVVAYFVGWVVGYVGRLWSVTLARWFRASAGKRPKAGRFPTRTPPALYPGPHPPYPTRYDKGHTRGGHPPPYGNATDETRDLPTHPTRRKPKLERNPGAQPANPHPWSPPRRPSRDPHTTPRAQTTPAAKQPELEPDAGAPTRPTSPPSSPPRRPSRDPHPIHRSQTNPAAKQAELEPDAGAPTPPTPPSA